MKRPGSLSLDLDNQWSYMKTHGDPGWEAFPSYLDLVVPRALDLLATRGLCITFFIVGQDAALESNRPALSRIAAAGHEIGNHSFRHEPWLHLYPEAEVEQELRSAEAAILAATGQRPRGFRGPGFSISDAVLRTLARLGYEYDASTFPTYIGPLARAYYFATSRLSREELETRRALFGSLRDGRRPNRPYRWRTQPAPLAELPVTTMPGTRLPIHVSYLLYIACLSPALARAYFATALSLCRATGTDLSLLLHPLDFLDARDVPELRFFPAMGLAAERKLALVNGFLAAFAGGFDVKPMREHAAALPARLPERACPAGAGRRL